MEDPTNNRYIMHGSYRLFPLYLLILALAGLVLMETGSVNAQRENTVFQPNVLFDQATTTPSAPVRNIGQSQHFAQIIVYETLGDFSDQCGIGHNTDITFEASFTNAVGSWFRIGNALPFVVPGPTLMMGTITADGAYPFVRINPVVFDTANCFIAAQYSGTISPGERVGSNLPGNDGSYGFDRRAVDITTATTTAVIAASVNTDLSACVYHLYLKTQGAQVVTFLNTGGANVWGPMHLAANDEINISLSDDVPLFCVSPGLSITTSGTTQLSGGVRFRYENPES